MYIKFEILRYYEWKFYLVRKFQRPSDLENESNRFLINLEIGSISKHKICI